MSKFIYADNAATTKLDIDAYEAMKPFLLNDYSNPSQPYSFSRQSKKALKEARCIIAKCINAEPNEIYFTSGGSESDNWAIKGVAFSELKGAVITSEIEHHAVLRACEDIEKSGIPVAYIKPDRCGFIQPQMLANYITDNTKLVSIMYVNNEIGTIEPIKELCEIAHSHGALFHTDAVQAVGSIKVDVKDLNIDILSASAHKFNGPKGIGFLYVKSGIKIHALINGGGQEFGYRAGTENVAAIVGMATALKNRCDSLMEIKQHNIELEHALLEELKDIPFRLNGEPNRKSGILSLSFPNRDGEQLLHRLDLLGVMISTGSACDSQRTQISHVLKAIDLDESFAKGTIRISFGKNNTVEEAKVIGLSLIKILQS